MGGCPDLLKLLLQICLKFNLKETGMSKREIFGIKIFFTGIILFVITLSVLNGFFQIQASKMSKNKLNKKHHRVCLHVIVSITPRFF